MFNNQKRPQAYDSSMEANKRTRTSDESVEVGMLFQHQDIGPVIGKGGENIKNIREKSGAQVHTSKFMPSVAERTAKIMGSAEQVASAIKMIIDTGSKDHPTVTLLAEYKNCGLLIGKQGVTIKQIRDETAAEIQVSKECIGNSTQKQIRISGEYEAVSKAIDAVVVHIAEARNPTRITYVPGEMAGSPNAAQGFANVNSATAGRGWTLAPDSGRPQGMSQVMGAFQNVGNRGAGLGGGGGASLMRIEMTVWIAKDLIGKIIGRGGLTVRAIRDQSTAHVFVHKDEEDTEATERRITIKGSKQAIDMAYSMIETLVAGG